LFSTQLLLTFPLDITSPISLSDLFPALTLYIILLHSPLKYYLSYVYYVFNNKIVTLLTPFSCITWQTLHYLHLSYILLNLFHLRHCKLILITSSNFGVVSIKWGLITKTKEFVNFRPLKLVSTLMLCHMQRVNKLTGSSFCREGDPKTTNEDLSVIYLWCKKYNLKCFYDLFKLNTEFSNSCIFNLPYTIV